MVEKSTEKKALKDKKRKKEIIIGLVLIGIAAFGTLGVFEILKVSLGTQDPLVVVTSGSMVPAINVGDLLVVGNKAPQDIKVGTLDNHTGDVIIYDPNGLWPEDYLALTDGEPIVHRVIGEYKNATDGLYYFETAGDYNHCPDPPCSGTPIWVPQTHILGVVLYDIPEIGYVKIWLTDSGLAIPIIVILGLLLLISIVYDITHPEQDKKEKEKDLKEIEQLPKDTDKKIDLGV